MDLIDSASDLIQRFEALMRTDPNILAVAIGRSRIRKELFNRGPRILGGIASHLETTRPSNDDHNMLTAWSIFLRAFGEANDITAGMPVRDDDLEGWIDWAKQYRSWKIM